MLVSIITSNLALGAICGIVAAIITFAVKISHIDVTKRKTEADHITYHISGQLFFASIESMLEQLDYDDDESHVTLDFKHAHLWDSTSVSAIQTAILNLEKHDKTVKIINLNSNSAEMLERMTKIRVENSQSSEGITMYKNIIVAVDMSENSYRAVLEATKLTEVDSFITLLNVRDASEAQREALHGGDIIPEDTIEG